MSVYELTGAAWRQALTKACADQADILLATSGSTGAPRHICRSLASWRAAHAVETQLFSFTAQDRFLVVGRPGFSLVPYVGLLAHDLGAAFSNWQPGEAKPAFHPTVIYGAPLALDQLMRTGDFLNPRLIFTGGADLPSAMRARFRRACPNALIRLFYGATETGYVAMEQADATGMGLFPGVEIKHDETGTAQVRSPYLAKGEWRNGKLLPLADTQGWVTLPDIVDWKQGRLKILGRADLRINSAGVLISPESIEAFLTGLPGIAEAVVLPMTLRGIEMPIALIRGDEIQRADLRRLCRLALPPEQRPRRFWRAADEFPRLDGGKPDRRAILRLAMDGQMRLERL